MNVNDILALLNSNQGLTALCLFILVGGYRGWWVWGRELAAKDKQIEQITREKELFRDLAFRGTALAETQIAARPK